MADYAAIDAARRTLELGNSATLAEIRTAYRALMRRWHPDKCADEPVLCRERAAAIATAYRLLTAYCRDFRFSFASEAIATQRTPEDCWREQFGSDPHWSNQAAPERKR